MVLPAIRDVFPAPNFAGGELLALAAAEVNDDDADENTQAQAQARAQAQAQAHAPGIEEAYYTIESDMAQPLRVDFQRSDLELAAMRRTLAVGTEASATAAATATATATATAEDEGKDMASCDAPVSPTSPPVPGAGPGDEAAQGGGCSQFRPQRASLHLLGSQTPLQPHCSPGRGHGELPLHRRALPAAAQQHRQPQAREIGLCRHRHRRRQ